MPKTFIVIFLFFITAPLSLWAQPEAERIQLQEFKQLIEQRVNDLQEYIFMIGNKELPMEQRQQAIDLAVQLFEKDYKVIEKGKEAIRSPYIHVSRRDGTVGSVSVRSYFNNLLGIKFKKIEILSYDLPVFGEAIKQNDGYYYATATYFRHFKGFSAGKMVYSDKDRKDIRITRKSMEVYKTFGKEDLKIVFGDITVREKRSN